MRRLARLLLFSYFVLAAGFSVAGDELPRIGPGCWRSLKRVYYGSSDTRRATLGQSYTAAKNFKNTPAKLAREIELTNYCEKCVTPFLTELKSAGTDHGRIADALSNERRRLAEGNISPALARQLQEAHDYYVSLGFPEAMAEHRAQIQVRLAETLPLAPFTEYDSRVLSLRKGDTVVFGDKKFRLGEFLGAGNRTHVFRLADQPDRVIRIPFLIKDHRGDLIHADVGLRYLVGAEPTSLTKRAKILESGDGYAVAEFINGTQNGQAFLKGIFAKHGTDPADFSALGERGNLVFSPVEIGLNAKMRDPNFVAQFSDPELKVKYDKLFAALARAKFTDNFDGRVEYLYNSTRQFIWDEQRKDWYLVDFE